MINNIQAHRSKHDKRNPLPSMTIIKRSIKVGVIATSVAIDDGDDDEGARIRMTEDSAEGMNNLLLLMLWV